MIVVGSPKKEEDEMRMSNQTSQRKMSRKEGIAVWSSSFSLLDGLTLHLALLRKQNTVRINKLKTRKEKQEKVDPKGILFYVHPEKR